jgi:hypothetical protein
MSSEIESPDAQTRLAEKATKAEEQESAENLRNCVSYAYHEGMKVDDYKFGPWFLETVKENGKELTRQTDEANVKEGYYRSYNISMPDGKEYAMGPDGKKSDLIDITDKTPGKTARKVERGSEEDKRIRADLDSVDFDNLPFCQTKKHEVKSGENLSSIVKEEVVPAEFSNKTIDFLAHKIAGENQLKNADRIYPGQELLIPQIGVMDTGSGK